MRITIVANSYPTVKMGGAEYQALLLAQGLADLGQEIVFMATKADEAGEFKVGKITGLKIPSWRIIGRTIQRKIILKTLQESEPDICYVRAFSDLATIVRYCKQAGVPVVSVSCSKMETSPLLLGYHPIETINNLRSGDAIFHLNSFLSIRSSTTHVCNTKNLQERIKVWFPHKSIQMIYNGQPVPVYENLHPKSSGKVIWVNNLKRLKRPEIFVELARRLPMYHFDMIGKMDCGKIYTRKLRSVFRQAPDNFQYLGPMSLDQVNARISQSDLLLYTSLPVEGFGNSFLQAWFRGVPTLSLSFDLDGIIESEGIGRCSKTFKQLVVDVKELMEDETTRLEMGRRARNYAVNHHSTEQMVAAYEMLFAQVIQ